MAPLLGIAAIVAVVAMYLMATTDSKDVDMPAPGATSEEVVAAWPQALDAHDEATREVAATASG